MRTAVHSLSAHPTKQRLLTAQAKCVFLWTAPDVEQTAIS